ncbi:TldD/PmbA family protein [candidate division KSB1 bacterium]|nr:TldD/PmbA family protein [candidate division KSB1 bacterium]
MNYKDLTSQLVKKCLRRGADAAEVYLENGRNLSIEVRNQDIETVKESAAHGVGFRVFVGGKMAFSSSNDLSERSLDDTIARAVSFARCTTADENNVLPEDIGFTEVEGMYDDEIARRTMNEKIELLKELEKSAMQDRRIKKSDGARYGEGEADVYLANSHGLEKKYRESRCYFGVSVVAEKGEQKSSGGEYCSRRFWGDLKPVDEVAAKAAESAYEMLDPRMVKTQKAAVIFEPDVAYAILGGILGAINGERVLQGASFLRDKMGQKIGSSLLTFIDDGTLARGLASSPFDGEGVPTQKQVIIEQGVLKGFIYNTMAARRAGVSSTGNASRGDFTSLPGIGAHNFYMTAGPDTPQEIIRSTKKGLLLKGVTGYGINAVNGHFSGGASGMWIENGRISFPVRGLTIAGNAFDMLNDIDMVANDLDLFRTRTTPTFRIREMLVGGE